MGTELKFAFESSEKKVIVKQIKNVKHHISNGHKQRFGSPLDPGFLLALSLTSYDFGASY